MMGKQARRTSSHRAPVQRAEEQPSDQKGQAAQKEQSAQNGPERSPRQRRPGPAIGRWAALAGSASVLVVASLVADGLAYAAKESCAAGAWNVGLEQYQGHCYTDIYPLYFTEGLSAGKIPYLDHHVEYPVIIGAVMQAVAWVVRTTANPAIRGLHFFTITVAVLALFLIAGVLATAYCAGPSRRWTALLVALSPALILSAYINWDIIAMSLMMLALAAWAAKRSVLAGVLLGLAIATKFYPIVALWPLFLLCLRAGRMRTFWVTTGAAAAAWLVVDLPFAIVARSGWATFYVFSATRAADWGSIFLYFEYMHWPVLGTYSVPTMNLLSDGVFVVACAAIGWLALAASRRPRLAQLIFLTTAAFIVTNKVWSPQYVVWLVPLVVLARPKIIGYLIWQAAEVAYFYAIWAYLITAVDLANNVHYAGGISLDQYYAAMLIRLGTVLLLSGLIVREALRPELDVVRSASIDDPGGGVLAWAPDRLVLRRGLPWLAAPAQPAH